MLKSTVGPEFIEIRINEPEKVCFKAPELIGDLINVYTNLAELDVFCKAVVHDDRSFKLEYLRKAHRILKKRLGLFDLSNLEKFIDSLPAYKQEEAEMD